MINKVILVGRLTRDFELKNKVAFGGIAVDKDFGKGADYIDLTAFGKTAEICVKVGRKGNLVAIEGSWNTYKNKEGKYISSCVVTILNTIRKNKDGEVTEEDIPVFDEEEESADEEISSNELPF